MNLLIDENNRAFRRKRALTQKELAKILGVSAQAITRWELGFSYPDLELPPAIAACLGITVDRLLGVGE